MTCAALVATIAACGGRGESSAKDAERGASPRQQSARAIDAVGHFGSEGAGTGSASGSGAASGYGGGAAGSAASNATPTHEAVRGDGVAGAAARLAATPRVTQGHKLVRHGDLRVIVNGVDGARIKLEQLADDAGGFVDREEVDHADGHASRATLVLHVPADQFMVVMRGARGLGATDRDETQTEDITEEYTDVAARLANTKRLEQRLLQLVDTRAGSMSDVLEVENQIAEVRGTIEEMEGRIQVWDDQVSMSRITVELALKPAPVAPPPAVAKVEPAPQPTWWDRIVGAASTSADALAAAGVAIALGLATMLPWIPIALIALLVLRAAGRRIGRVLRARRLRTDAASRADADLTARAAVAAAQAAGIAAAMEVAAAVD
jgi:hypothetical protein